MSLKLFIRFIFFFLHKSACVSWEKGMQQASSQYKNMYHKIMAIHVFVLSPCGLHAKSNVDKIPEQMIFEAILLMNNSKRWVQIISLNWNHQSLWWINIRLTEWIEFLFILLFYSILFHYYKWTFSFYNWRVKSDNRQMPYTQLNSSEPRTFIYFQWDLLRPWKVNNNYLFSTRVIVWKQHRCTAMFW